MPNQEFKEGDVVQLKSGGPKMTIEKYPCYEQGLKYDDRADCTWFDGSKPYSQRFPLITLKKVE